jgi:hypothetical protein
MRSPRFRSPVWLVLVLAALAAPVRADYLCDITLEPSVQEIAPGETATIEVWLRNIRRESDVTDTDQYAKAVELAFILESGLTFVTGDAFGDGFLENDPPIPSEFDLLRDDDLGPGDTTIGYSTSPGTGTSGIPIPAAGSSTDRLLGTFTVTGTTPGAYIINFDTTEVGGTPLFTYLITDGASYFTATISPAQVTVVPEPGTVGLVLASFGLMLAARRRRRKPDDDA